MNRIVFPLLTRLTVLVAALLAGTLQIPSSIPQRVSPTENGAVQTSSRELIALANFTQRVTNGDAGQIAGVYAMDVFALPVVQQPAGRPAYISTQAGVLTEFSLAAPYGSLGFLAHNNLAGSLFQGLHPGNTLVVIFGDGAQGWYRIAKVRHFQAFDPTSPTSNYLDLEQGDHLTYTDLFQQTYGQAGDVILQTCISSGGIESWGRLFVIATPYTP